MRRIILFLGIILIGVVSLTCATKVEPVSSIEEKVKVEAKTGWEADWQRIIKAAQQEKTVVIQGGSGAAALKDHLALVKKKYGLELEITSARGSEILAKIYAERRAGLYIPDIIFTGYNTLYTLKHEGLSDPMEPWLLLPEITDIKSWAGEKLPWADKDKHIFRIALTPSPYIVVNTNQVRQGEINSYYDLLDPKWKGKIIINDPSVSGQGNGAFNALIYYKIVDLDYFRKLAAQSPLITRDLKLMVDWVAKGKYSVVLFPTEGDVENYIKAGAPIAPAEVKEGYALGSPGAGLILLNKRPHPNAAGVFLNWLLSREGSTLWQNVRGTQSAREDVPTEGLNPLFIRRPGVSYFQHANEIEEFILGEAEKYFEWSREIFGPPSR